MSTQLRKRASKNFSTYRRSLLVLVLVMAFCEGPIFGQVNIIFDTDMGSDCDDAGAMAVLHKLADKGEVNILGVIFSSNKNKFGLGVCDAINTYYGRGDLPMGQYQGKEVGDPMDHYSSYIAHAREIYEHDVIDTTTDLVTAYKQILKAQPDSSVTILTVGHPHGLWLVLADQEGAQLINKKVKEWIAMGYSGEKPTKDWNFGRNGAERYVGPLLEEWPKDFFISAAGSQIITGHRKLPETREENPVRKAYELWNKAIVEGRSSWDQMAVLFAVRREYFGIDSVGSLRQTENLETVWDAEINKPNHRRVVPLKDISFFENIIEELMSEEPQKK